MADLDAKERTTLQRREAESSLSGNIAGDVEKQLATAPENEGKPYSVFTRWQKRAIVLGASGTAFFSPLTAQIYLPALTQLSRDLNVTNTQINLTITTYMIFQGITPTFIGSFADSGGRRPAYILCFIIYIAANIGLALAPGYGALLGLRCLQSAGSSSTVALCTAVVADIVTSAERGQYVGLTVIPTVLAPSLGPIIGGLLSQYLGWRAIFWFLAILGGIALVLIVLFFPETCRSVVGDGSLTPPRMYRSAWQSIHFRRKRQARRQHSLSRATTNSSNASKASNKFKFKAPNFLRSLFLLFERETGLLLWTSSIVFAGFYCIATAMPSLLSKRYGFNEIQIGLMYLPLALGSIVAATIVGPSINRNYRRHCLKSGTPYDQSRQSDLSNFPVEQARLEIGLPLLCLGGASIIGWGWAMHAVTHIALPCVISFFLGIGMIGFNNTTSILLVDVHPGRAGTVTAANNLTRCLVGAGASAAVIPMISAIGAGPAFTLIGGLYFVCIIPLSLVLRFGMKWRAEAEEKTRRKKLADAGKESSRAPGS
ncbi:Major facilitator superfamily domain, general substrate transporter [Metarhizium album ARSEF 1941]|uniref:Major facilitator superfamily domain, general substrate transporter n=1 Tax=Metarhizium album (strain ARSEF 1941) TaxID=1081103 RepID=A0A0B2WPV8_METAS|nr:Major facilitator superfamily domain, general substrate transporter [Metarhizium album ARSEF 1941]KHN95025.1 Major facilitator superfamily domain, general substrate transporter [Metarhizium album ARSEF 1941]